MKDVNDFKWGDEIKVSFLDLLDRIDYEFDEDNKKKYVAITDKVKYIRGLIANYSLQIETNFEHWKRTWGKINSIKQSKYLTLQDFIDWNIDRFNSTNEIPISILNKIKTKEQKIDLIRMFEEYANEKYVSQELV